MIQIILLILILLFPNIPLYSQDVRVEPGDFWEKAAEWEPRLSTEQLITSSLTASGLTGNKLREYEEKYRRLLGTFQQTILQKIAHLSPEERGELLLEWIHKTLLKQYVYEQTLMHVLLDTGKYNCVSSTLLYLIFARESNLNIRLIEAPDHVFCSIRTVNDWIDVETTTSFGFNPGVKKEFINDYKQTGFTYVPPGNYRYRKMINDKEGVALILQNRMAELQKTGTHREVVGLAVDRWTFVRNTQSGKEMNDAFKNWAAVLNDRHLYFEAFQFIDNVSNLYGLKNENRELFYGLAYNYLLTFLNNKDYNGAEEFLLAEGKKLNHENRLKLERILQKDRINFLVTHDDFSASLPAVQKAYSSGYISRNDWENFVTFLYQEKAVRVSKTSGYLAAWEFLRNLPEKEKKIKGIHDITYSMHQNWAITIHNRFVEAANGKNYLEAGKILQNGLAKDPGNTLFLKDLDSLNKAVNGKIGN